jgi:transcriptional regulator with XRE-family HTH domain
MDIGKRLKEERERLGYSQPAFASLVNASKSSLIRWEAGTQMPDASALAAWAAIGLDVLYVVMGSRSPTTLNKREEALLDNYRNCDAHGQSIIESVTSAAAQPPAAKAANSSHK